MVDKNGLELGTAAGGHPGKRVLCKNITAADTATLRDTFGYKTDPIDGSTLIFTDLDSAIGVLRSGLGDEILLSSGYTETVSAAGDIDFDVAGSKLIGLGVGDARPKITFDTVDTADMDFGADNLLVENIIFVNDVDGLNEPLDIEASVDNVTFRNCEFRDDTAAKQTDAWFVTAATNTNLQILDCRHVGSDTAGATAFVTFVGGSKHVVKGLKSNGDFSAANIRILTTLTSDILIEDCTLENANAVDVNIEGNSLSSTGWIRNCSCRIATDGQTTWINNVGGITIYESFGADNSGEAGQRIGTANTGSIEDDVSEILTDTGTTLPATLATIDGIVDDILVDTGTTLPATLAALPQCVAKVDGAVLTGNDDLFVITGGPVRARIVGVVTTIIGGASNMDLQIVTTTPAATVNLNAAPVAINDDAAGTSYYNVGATSVFTPVTAGAVILDPVTVDETYFILPIGTVHARGSAAQTGVIAWYMTFEPLSPLSVVTAAA